MESITDDMEGNVISGPILYFMLQDGRQRTIEVYNADIDINILAINFYRLDKTN